MCCVVLVVMVVVVVDRVDLRGLRRSLICWVSVVNVIATYSGRRLVAVAVVMVVEFVLWFGRGRWSVVVSCHGQRLGRHLDCCRRRCYSHRCCSMVSAEKDHQTCRNHPDIWQICRTCRG